jgi:hypothetical protein
MVQKDLEVLDEGDSNERLPRTCGSHKLVCREARGGSQFRNTLLSDYPHTPMTCILRTASLPPALLSASTSEKINSTIVHDSLLWGPRR